MRFVSNGKVYPNTKKRTYVASLTVLEIKIVFKKKSVEFTTPQNEFTTPRNWLKYFFLGGGGGGKLKKLDGSN